MNAIAPYADQLLAAAFRVLTKSGEEINEQGGRYYVNGIEQTAAEVISYAKDLYEADTCRRFSPLAYTNGRPKTRVREQLDLL